MAKLARARQHVAAAIDDLCDLLRGHRAEEMRAGRADEIQAAVDGLELVLTRIDRLLSPPKQGEGRGDA